VQRRGFFVGDSRGLLDELSCAGQIEARRAA
jgi:hypothetical protein